MKKIKEYVLIVGNDEVGYEKHLFYGHTTNEVIKQVRVKFDGLDWKPIPKYVIKERLVRMPKETIRIGDPKRLLNLSSIQFVK